MKPTDILHRAKCEDTNEWLYGYYTQFQSPKDMIMKHCITTEDSDYTKVMGCDPYTLCTYTTLTDKNGKKVFTGDIIYKKWINGDGREEEVRHLIVFYDGAFFC